MNPPEEKIIPLSQRQATLPSRWRLWLARIPLQAIASLLALTAVIGGLLWVSRQRELRAEEAMRTPALTGNALVEEKGYFYGPRRTFDERCWISFEINGHKGIRYTTLDNDKWDKWRQTRVGDTVVATYHIGKDGDYYMEDWQPPGRKQQISLPR